MNEDNLSEDVDASSEGLTDLEKQLKTAILEKLNSFSPEREKQFQDEIAEILRKIVQ